MESTTCATEKEVKPCRHGNITGSSNCFNDIYNKHEYELSNITDQILADHTKFVKESSNSNSNFSGREGKRGYFADQFENLANFRTHCDGTSPVIWDQTGGNLHAFVAAATTGGTLPAFLAFLRIKHLLSSVS